jgi:hypothetical protein
VASVCIFIVRLLPRNRLSPRYINIATTPIQQFENQKNAEATAKNMPKKKEMTAKAK